ncbi:MAG: alkaline phosphatase family protein, partial [Myxococcota bacterium]
MKQITKFLRRWLVLLVSPFLAAAAAAETLVDPGPPADRPPVVILISLDGTRPADLNARDLPVLMGLADRGLRAERLLPVLPTNTFPNHVTLVTGVAPERHGIVNNLFIDPERGFFERDNIPSWIQVEPLWSLLERRGITSAAYHWVGSE